MWANLSRLWTAEPVSQTTVSETGSVIGSCAALVRSAPQRSRLGADSGLIAPRPGALLAPASSAPGASLSSEPIVARKGPVHVFCSEQMSGGFYLAIFAGDVGDRDQVNGRSRIGHDA